MLLNMVSINEIIYLFFVKFMTKVVNEFENKFIKFVTIFESDNERNFKNNMTIKILTLILRKLNQKIGSDTSINYRINPLDVKCKNEECVKKYKFILTFPIQQHGIKSNEELLNQTIDTLSEFIPNFNWEHIHKQYLWLWKTLYQLDYKPNSYLKYDDFKTQLSWGPSDEVIKKYEPKLRQTILKDGSKLKEIVDPFVNDYGVYINLSVPFNDMDYGYNYLHYYEHMMTYAWKTISQQDMLEMNGATTCHALCYVYNIHSTRESFETYLKSYLEFHMKSRSNSFWTNELLDGMNMELERTMSETLLDKSYANMAKTDPKSQHQYNSKILEYYSNKPFEIIVYCPCETDAKKISETIVTSNITNVKSPNKLKFNYYPLHVCRDKTNRKYLILQKESGVNPEVNSKTNNPTIEGVDCYIKCEENLSELNTILMQLLLKEGQELKDVLVKTPTPNSNLNFGSASCYNDNITSYFENYNENI